MTFKEKYNSIDQSKLPENAKSYMAEFKKDSDNFTNKQAMALMMPVLDRFIKGLKDSGYGDAIKGGAKKETKKAETPKEMAKEIVEEAVEQPETKTGKPKIGKISKGDFMKIAKEIRKEGEPWNSAMKRAGEIIRTQKEVVKKEATRQYEKLKKFIEKHPEVYPMDIPVRGGGFRKTTINRDAPRVALPKGKRVSRAGWKNQYGKSDGGKIYYEYRSNRYDTRRQRYPFLADGGEIDAIFADGGKTGKMYFKEGDIVYVFQSALDKNGKLRKGIDQKFVVGDKQKWAKVEVKEIISDELGWERYRGKKIDGDYDLYDRKAKNGEMIAFFQSSSSKYNNKPIAMGYTEEERFYAKGGELGKNYYTMQNVGRSKYVINSYDGVKTHKDGSPFYDIDIYKNKVDFQKAIKRLEAEGYVSRYAKGGYTATGEDYEYVNTFGITQPDFEEIVEAWHKGNSLRNTDRINSRLVFRKMENKYGENKIEEISEYIMKTHEGHEHYAKGGEMGKLDAGVYRVGKPKKVSPYSYEQKIVEIFENGDISTASDYARKASDFYVLSKYPVISEKQLEAQYKYAKGGSISKSTTYISNRDIESVNAKIKNKKVSLKGSDILDGVYAKNEALKKPFDLTDAYNEITNLSYDVWDKLGIESGGAIYNSDAIQKKLANEYEKSGVDAAYMKYNAAQRREIREMLTDENQHSLRNYFALRGYSGDKEYNDYKSLYGEYIKEKRKLFLNPSNVEYQPKKKFAKGGKIGFKGLSEKVAKYYANKSVPSKYQTLYGKKYDKAEAKEVGDKVAAKVYRQQQAKK